LRNEFFIKSKNISQMGQNETKEVAVQERSKSNAAPEYIPIELFLYTKKDNNLVAWIMDNIGVLRSVFKITQLSINKDTRLTLKDHVYVFSFTPSSIEGVKQEKKWHLESSLTIVGQEHNGDVCIFHFIDGTAAMISEGTLYYLHFEECPDDLFDEIKKEPSIVKYEEEPIIKLKGLVINDDQEESVVDEHKPKISGRWSNLIEKTELRKCVVVSNK
jgi:hypothetical protein